MSSSGNKRPNSLPGIAWAIIVLGSLPVPFVICCGGLTFFGSRAIRPAPTPPPTADRQTRQGKPAAKAKPRPFPAKLVGTWKATTNRTFGDRLTVFEDEGGKLWLRHSFDATADELIRPLTKGVTPNGLTRYHVTDRPSHSVRVDDRWVIEGDGALVAYDSDGRINNVRYVPLKP